MSGVNVHVHASQLQIASSEHGDAGESSDADTVIETTVSRLRPGIKRTCILFPEELHARICDAAREDHRCFSPMVVKLVERALQAMESPG